MTREEFYKLTDILNSEVLGNFMHGGEADELIAMFEEAVEHSNILEQEEPISEELEEAAEEYEEKGRIDAVVSRKRDFINGAKWQKEQDKETIELAEDHAMLAGMEKMKEQMMANIWKPANGDDLPKINREVIALLNNGKVVFAHRPYKRKYIGKSLTTGKIKTFENQTYDKGEWNMPNVKYWLDVELPKEIEL